MNPIIHMGHSPALSPTRLTGQHRKGFSSRSLQTSLGSKHNGGSDVEDDGEGGG
jgi:hypothetical protein